MRAWCCAASIASLLAAAPASARGSSRARAPVAGEQEVDPPALDAEALLARLRELGPKTLTGVVRVLSGLDPETGRELAGLDRELLGLDRAAALDLLEPLRREAIAEGLKSCAPSAARERTTLGLLRVLERFGSAADLLGAARWTQDEIEAHGSDFLLESALRSAACHVLRRDPRSFEWISGVIQSSRAEVALPLCLAVGDAASLRGLPVLGGLLGWNSALDVSLLQQIARLAALGETVSDPTLCGVVRGFLRSGEPGLACEAAIACGRLEDFDAADDLVDLLESDERSVREASAWALGRLTGLAYQDDTQRWRAWLASEQAWLENEAPALIADLEHTDASRAIRCLGELSRRRYRRDELGAAMCVALDDERPQVRKLACTALARLGSKAVVPELIASLDDGDDEVTAAALAALRSITGMDLPAVSQAWKAADPGRAGGR